MPTIFTRMERSASPAPLATFITIGVIVAFWPLLGWYVARFCDGSDDPLGLLALALALFMAWRNRANIRPSRIGGWIACGLIGLEMLLHPVLPPLAEAVLCVVTLCVAFGLPSRAPGLALLLLMSLPIVASMQFYFGYHLRLIAALLADVVLKVLGCSVTRLGTDFLWHGAQVGVDPPCSGVKMLWMGCFVGAVLAAWSHLRASRVIALMIGTVVMVVLSNALRALLLMPTEAGVVHAPTGVHDAFGFGCMMLGFWGVARWHDRLANRASSLAPNELLTFSHSFAAITALGLGLATGLLHVVQHKHTPPMAIPLAPGWPKQFEGYSLEPLPLSTRERVFANTFPGHIARFRMGASEVVFRNVTQATRKLHSSRDCFRAAGYEIEPCRLSRDERSRVWARFAATRGSQRLLVREQIQATNGAGWTDVSDWYWSALLNASQGPWLAITVIEDGDSEHLATR